MVRFSRNNRPAGKPRRRPSATRPPEGDFKPLFTELMKTRWQYEAMRSSDGSLLERAVMIDRLQELRADLARARSRDLG